MATTVALAKTFVANCIAKEKGFQDKWRQYAVVNFHQGHKDASVTKHLPDEARQEAWARHLQYNKKNWGSEGGALEKAVEVYYTPGKDPSKDTPTLVSQSTPGAKKIMVNGYGQCGWFFVQAYNLLKKPAKTAGVDVGKAPIIQQVNMTAFKHNWVIVNGDAALDDRVGVDLWLYALGVPFAQCINCTPKEAALPDFFKAPMKVVKTYDPNTGTETVGEK